MRIILIIILIIFLLPFVKGEEIHEAAKNGDLKEIQILLEYDPSLLNLKDNQGMVPLHYAIESGYDHVAIYLIEKGAKVDIRNIVDGATPFHYATYKGSMEVAQLILNYDRSLLEEKDLRKKTALIYACEGGKPEMVEYLLDCGANLQIRDQMGFTPLMSACSGWNMEVVKILIKRGLDMNEVVLHQNREYTALTIAALYGFREMIDYLIDLRADISVSTLEITLQYAVQGNHLRLFKYILDKGLKLNENPDDYTDLIYRASAAGAEEIFCELIQMGMNTHGQDLYGWTVFHHAASQGRTNMIGFLLAHVDIDVDTRSFRGETPYNVAGFLGFHETQEYLKTLGADTSGVQFPEITGIYMGQPPPGKTPHMFMPGIVSGPYRAHGTVVFSPDGTEAYWSDMIPGSQCGMEMKMTEGRWSYPARSKFWKDPSLSPDGYKLIYISSQPVDENDSGGKENYWYMNRTDSGWTDPRPMDPIINKINVHWQCSMDISGNLYFSEFDNNMYISEFIEDKYQEPVNLKIHFDNSTLAGHSPFIAPDGNYLVFADQGRLYISFKTGPGSWTDRIDLGNEINSGSENGSPRVSNDGQYLFFQSTSGEKRPWGIYWVSAEIIDRLKKERIPINKIQ